MSLSDLPASELARIDSICLRYEADLRNGKSRSIDELVAQQGGRHAELLRRELIAVRDELGNAPSGTSSAPQR